MVKKAAKKSAKGLLTQALPKSKRASGTSKTPSAKTSRAVLKKVASKKSPKKTTLPRASLKKNSAKTLKTKVQRKLGRTQSVDVLVDRSKPRSTSEYRSFAYYSMGALALGISVCVIGYQMTQSADTPGAAHPEVVTLSPPASERHHEQPLAPKAQNSPLFDEFQKVQSLEMDGRIQFWSAFLQNNLNGRKKLFDALANQRVDDSVPLIPKDYDCTTFVETVAALSQSQTLDDVSHHLIAIRYKDGHPGFVQRNHFPEADWIPNNIQVHVLKDITAEIAQLTSVPTQHVSKEIDRYRWLQAQIKVQFKGDQQGRTLASSILGTLDKNEATPLVHAELEYISVDSLTAEMVSHIPTGTVVNLVHENSSEHPVLITHQGFIVREGQKVFLRHASKGGRIRTSELTSYLKSLSSRQGPDTKWPLIGVNLIQINDSTSAKSLRSDAM